MTTRTKPSALIAIDQVDEIPAAIQRLTDDLRHAIRVIEAERWRLVRAGHGRPGTAGALLTQLKPILSDLACYCVRCNERINRLTDQEGGAI